MTTLPAGKPAPETKVLPKVKADGGYIVHIDGSEEGDVIAAICGIDLGGNDSIKGEQLASDLINRAAFGDQAYALLLDIISTARGGWGMESVICDAENLVRRNGDMANPLVEVVA